MYVALMCKDNAGALQTRLDTREDHLAFLKDLDAKGILKIAGPLLDENDKPCGSLIILNVEDKTEAEQIAKEDPYAKVGLFAEVDIKPYTWVFHEPSSEIGA
ncbi:MULTISPECIES: YciI family protein [unclassified Lentilitoribacter]|jgi:uncharacterized protein YciI|uniref:YciI family protein n=1 Tax=unclassified Lentilitoribacter TaxID=2647570 RepID=UPI0013A6E2D4|nr:YciI family protein [Lentilitoribacter sp. Alg239-R112]